MKSKTPHNKEYQGGLSLAEAQAQLKNRLKDQSFEIHKLSSNENPLGPAPAVVDALSQAAASLHFYPPRHDRTLRQAISRSPFFAAETITPEHLCCSHGASSVLELIMRVLAKPGEQIIISPPTFGLYPRIALKLGLETVNVPLDPSNFSLPLDSVLRAITPATRLLILCSPNNPTGTQIDESTLKTLVKNLPPHVHLLVDEAYVEYIDEEGPSFAIRPILAEQRVISVRSFSKIHGLAGLRLGYAIAPPSITALLRKQQSPFHLSTLQIEGGTAAVSCHPHAIRSRDLNHAGKQQLYALFDELELCYWKSQANFVLFRPKGEANSTQQQLLERGFMVRETESFGLPGCIRVSTGSSPAMQGFCAALKEITR